MARVLLLVGLLALVQGDIPQLLGVVQDVKAPLADREAAVKSLGKTKPGGLALLELAARNQIPTELKATASFALAACTDADVRAKGEQLLPRPKSKDGKALPPISELAEMKGDAKAGAAVFRNNNGGPNCIGCHQIGDEGRQVGPPLTTIGNKLSKEQFYEAILTPSAAILMSFELWIVRTKDGDIKTGIKSEDTDDHITLKDSNGEYIDIPVSKIAEKKQSALSMMPEDITKSMSVKDLVDVVEYLQQQK
ncbi:MAG TPA: c-type cytochrome [Planctomycetota bacterium]|jgi:putative heme-binding domain-containing protein|nr:c-type cytochrome [Planctomycetota bacterium]